MKLLGRLLARLLGTASDAAWRRERRLWIVLFGVSFALALALLADRARTGAELSSLDRSLLDLALQRSADTSGDTSAVTVVLVDDATLADMGLRWPLPRKVWADFVRATSAYDPAALVLSAWFEAPEDNASRILATEAIARLRQAGLTGDDNGAATVRQLERLAIEFDGDRQLSDAIARAGDVVLGIACLPAVPSLSSPAPPGVRVHPAEPGQRPRLACRAVSGNHQPLAEAAAGQGTLALLQDPDDHSRRYPYLATWQGAWVPSLALEAVRVGRPDAHDAALRQVTRLDGAAPILRAAPPEAFTRLRFGDVLQAEPGHSGLAKALTGRIVIVGVNARGTEDYELSALDRATPGTFIHANAIVDLLGQRHLQTQGPAALWGLLCGGFLLMALYLGTRGIRRLLRQVAIAVAAAGLWSGLAIWRMSHGDVIAVAPVWLGIAGWLLLHVALAGRRVNRSRNAYRAAKQRMKGELAVGREIQDSLLPPLDAVLEACPRLDAHAVVQPAREIGGDLYDLFPLEDGRVCLSVGDVSDKGVPAALFMAVATTLIRSMARLDPHPASITRRVNDELSRNNEGSMFVTLFLAVLDMDAGTLTYTSAGHNPPYLREGGEWTALRDRHGPVLGAMAELEYGESVVPMKAENMLLVYTDGVTEATDPDDELYGDARLEAVLAAVPADDDDDTDDDASAVVARVLADVEGFESGATQADDITVLAVRYTATTSPS